MRPQYVGTWLCLSTIFRLGDFQLPNFLEGIIVFLAVVIIDYTPGRGKIVPHNVNK